MTKREGPPKPSRFVADLMLIRLARWLRMLGQDVDNPPSDADQDILAYAKDTGRTLLTRDVALAASCVREGVSCILITSCDLDDQLLEVARSAGFEPSLNPTRCTVCNGSLVVVRSSDELYEFDKDEDISSPTNYPNSNPLKHEPTRTLWSCTRCGKLYWEGSHWSGIEKRLEALKKRLQDSKS